MTNNPSLPPASLPVAALMLCHRNDKRLEAALASVAWAQQILVLDTKPESGIPWKKYADQYPQLKVVRAQTFELHFSAWRNYLLEHVTQPWVFFIDSDEVAEIRNHRLFTEIISRPPQSFAVQRTDYLLGKPLRFGEVGSVWLTRLGPHLGLRFKRVVHETTLNQGTRTPALILHHYSHLNLQEFVDKVVLYSSLEGKSRDTKTSSATIFLQALSFPFLKFIYSYIFLAGFLDGWRGLVYASIMSLHSFLVRVFWYEQKYRLS